LVSSYGVDANYNGSKTTRIPILKVHINGKLTLEWKKNMFNGPYVMINQLINSI
jgi:hypothetical protein